MGPPYFPQPRDAHPRNWDLSSLSDLGNSASLITDLLRAPYAPTVGSPCFPHPTEETFVSWLDQRGRPFRSCKALWVLLLSVEGIGPNLWRGKLRHKAAKQHSPIELQILSFCLSPHLPSALPAPWVTPLALGVGEFCPQASVLACFISGAPWPGVKVQSCAWGSGQGGREGWWPDPRGELPRRTSLHSWGG